MCVRESESEFVCVCERQSFSSLGSARGEEGEARVSTEQVADIYLLKHEEGSFFTECLRLNGAVNSYTVHDASQDKG